MKLPLTGGCACGQVRYECSAEPLFVAHCHCKDCQRASGGQMATVAGVPVASFHLTEGKTKSFHYSGDSGHGLDRHFCEVCGSRLFTDNVGVLPDVMFIAVGSLDEPGQVVPAMHIFTDSAQPWASIPETLQRFARMPG